MKKQCKSGIFHTFPLLGKIRVQARSDLGSHQGLKLQNDLVNVLVRFTRSPVAQVCDITQMSLQVHVQPSYLGS